MRRSFHLHGSSFVLYMMVRSLIFVKYRSSIANHLDSNTFIALPAEVCTPLLQQQKSTNFVPKAAITVRLLNGTTRPDHGLAFGIRIMIILDTLELGFLLTYLMDLMHSAIRYCLAKSALTHLGGFFRSRFTYWDVYSILGLASVCWVQTRCCFHLMRQHT